MSKALDAAADQDLVAAASTDLPPNDEPGAVGLEGFANAGSCDDCGHMAIKHLGGENVGPCTIEGCDCSAFVATEVSDATPFSELLDRVAGLPGGDELAATIRLRLEGLELVADGAVALPAEHQPAEHLPDPNASPATPTPPAPSGAQIRWRAMIVPEGAMTDDGRAFAPGSITWRELPLSLGAMLDTPHADVVTSSEVCGRIDSITRVGNDLWAEGVFDGGEYGQKIAGMVGEGTLRGVSVDVAVKQYEVAYKADYFDEDGAWVGRGEDDEREEPDMLDMLFGGEGLIFLVTEGVIGAVTVCPFPAFADARIEVAASLVAGGSPAVWTLTQQAGFRVSVLSERDVEADEAADEAADPNEAGLTASAAGLAPVTPPAGWFDDPELDELTPLTVTDDGRVYGHAWAWDVCHIGIAGTCTTAPRSNTGYAYFHLGELVCDDAAVRRSVGKITLDTGHAGRGLGRADATAHYDDTGTVVADVRVGEDEHGGWVAGAIRPDVSAEDARKLRAAALSGDWRSVNGNLELVALLAVNVPGFPVPRARALVASSDDGVAEVLALVAAGINPLSLHDDDPDFARRFAELRERARVEVVERQESFAAGFERLRARADGRFDELAARARG